MWQVFAVCGLFLNSSAGLPPPPSCASMLQLGRNSTSIAVDGKSHDLGNLINYLTFAGIKGYLGAKDATVQLKMLWGSQCPDAMCFGKYLVHSLHDNISFGTAGGDRGLATLVQELNAVKKKENFHVTRGPGMHSLNMLKKVLFAAPDLAALAKSYASTFAPELLHLQPALRRCTVHFRVGDISATPFCKGHFVFDPASIAAAVASFSPLPESVEILNGGSGHCFLPSKVSGELQECPASMIEKLQRKSDALLNELQQAIETQIPGVQVVLGSKTSAPDEDWFKLATSPMMVISAGTFGVTAALASVNSSIRSPAMTNGLCPQLGQEAPGSLRSGWSTYAYALKEW